MEKLFIDIDDVVCSNSVLPTINEVLQKNYSFDHFKTFYMQEIIPENKKQEYYKLVTSRDLYYNCVFNKDVVETIKKLSNHFDVYFISSVFMQGAEGKASRFFADKYNLLVKNFPFISEKKFIFAHDKSIINGDILIDDNIKNLTNNYKLKLLYTAYHNKSITNEELKLLNIIRVNNWAEIEKYLLKHKTK